MCHYFHCVIKSEELDPVGIISSYEMGRGIMTVYCRLIAVGVACMGVAIASTSIHYGNILTKYRNGISLQLLLWSYKPQRLAMPIIFQTRIYGQPS